MVEVLAVVDNFVVAFGVDVAAFTPVVVVRRVELVVVDGSVSVVVVSSLVVVSSRAVVGVRWSGVVAETVVVCIGFVVPFLEVVKASVLVVSWQSVQAVVVNVDSGNVTGICQSEKYSELRTCNSICVKQTLQVLFRAHNVTIGYDC